MSVYLLLLVASLTQLSQNLFDNNQTLAELPSPAEFHKVYQNGTISVFYANRSVVLYDSSLNYLLDFQMNSGNDFHNQFMAYGRNELTLTTRYWGLSDQYYFYWLSPFTTIKTETKAALIFALGEDSLHINTTQVIAISTQKIYICDNSSCTNPYNMTVSTFQGCLYRYPNATATSVFCWTANRRVYEYTFSIENNSLTLSGVNHMMSFSANVDRVWIAGNYIFVDISNGSVIGEDFTTGVEFALDSTLTADNIIEIVSFESEFLVITQTKVMSMQYNSSSDIFEFVSNQSLTHNLPNMDRLCLSINETSGEIMSFSQPGGYDIYKTAFFDPPQVEQTVENTTKADTDANTEAGTEETQNNDTNADLKEQLSIAYEEMDDSVKLSTESASTINALPSIRPFLRFLAPFFGFFDDYWNYIYHDNQYQGLVYVPAFLNVLYQINNERIFPPIEKIEAFQEEIISYGANAEGLTNQRILSINEEPTYFMYNTRAMVISQFAFSLLVFFLVNMIYRLCLAEQSQSHGPENRQNQIDQSNNEVDKSESRNRNVVQDDKSTGGETAKSKLHLWTIQFFQEMSSWKNLAVMMIEGNLIFVFFQAGRQLRNLSALNFADKFNLLVSLSMLFVFLLFSTCFFLVFRDESSEDTKEKQPKSKSQKNANAQRGQYSQSITLTLLVGYKNLFNGIFHSYFLDHLEVLYCLIILSKIFLLVAIIGSNKVLETKGFKALTALYYFFGIVLDAAILLSHVEKVQVIFSPDVVNSLEICCLTCIIGFILLLTVYQFVWDNKDICSNHQNKIRSEPNSEIQNIQNIQQKIHQGLKKVIFLQSCSNQLDDIKNPTLEVLNDKNVEEAKAQSNEEDQPQPQKNKKKIRVKKMKRIKRPKAIAPNIVKEFNSQDFEAEQNIDN